MQEIFIDFNRNFKKNTIVFKQILGFIINNPGFNFNLNSNSKKKIRIGSLESFKKNLKKKSNQNIIGLLTSGTTGSPKIVKNKLKIKKKKSKDKLIWLLTYSPYRWAGISVLLHTIINDLEIVIPSSINPLDILKKIHLVTAISMTPSFFKKMLLYTNKKKIFKNIKQITFGGEYVNQSTLDLSKKIFPNARLTSIYAISEIGDICTSSDGKEGFEKNKFKKFKFINNELIINNKKTNDLWQLKKDRYFFLGRKNDIVNIGCNTISLQVVKNELNKIKEIKIFKLKSLANPILGNIIELEYVGNISQNNIESKLIKKLPKYALPISFKKLKNIELNSNNKS